MRAPLRAAASANAAQPRPDGTTFAPTWHSASSRRVAVRDGREAAEPAPRDVLEEDALDRILGTEREHLLERRRDGRGHGRIISHRPVRVAAMPIHLRAEPGDYADAVLLPGDPLRAKYIADTYLEDVNQVNEERGLLGYTGTWEGKPVSVQGTGMGCPGATIVFEELIQLGCKKLMRVGTCGGLQPHHALGDLIVALTRRPGRRDREASRRRRAALPDRVLGARPRRRARGEGDRPADARRADRLERRLLQPGRRPVRALVEPRRPRRRDGGGGALHRRRARRDRQGGGRPRRLPPHRLGHRRRGQSSRGSRTTSCAPRSTG